MISEETINDLPELLGPFLGSKTIIGTKITRLTAPGENFGSVMLKVDFTVRDQSGKEDKVYAVAKKLPATELFREIFNIQVTYKNEVAFYDTIIPTLKKFEEDEGVGDRLECFAELYGARLNLNNNNSDKVEEDAVLVLENLIAAGYGNIDRQVGFDLDAAEYLIRDMANFHGTTLALKLKQPEVFAKKLKLTCHNYIPKSDFGVICLEAVQDILSENPECHHLIPKVALWGHRPIPEAREPFATVAHSDFWVNNTLQKFDNGKIVGNKFVDFQVYAYRSAVSDLFFYIWSSVQLVVLQNHLDHLLHFYHDNLIRTLEKFHCDTREFSFEAFLKEMEIEANFEFGHALQFGTFVVNGKKGGSEMKEIPDKHFFLKSVTPKVKEYVWFMALECERRGWLY